MKKILAAGGANSTAQVWSSPMQRALRTAQPIAEGLGLRKWFCHGGLYEFRAKIPEVRGASICADPTLQGVCCVHFNAEGAPDRRHISGASESEGELRIRAADLARWLETLVASASAATAPADGRTATGTTLSGGRDYLFAPAHALDASESTRCRPNNKRLLGCLEKGLALLIVVAHQTLLDCLVRQLVDGSDRAFEYGYLALLQQYRLYCLIPPPRFSLLAQCSRFRQCQCH